MASILQSGKRRRGARGICASIALAARKKPLLRDEHDHAADWLHCSVCKNKCMLLCMLVSFNECVSASTRRETSHIDSPLRLAARGSRTPMPCSAASASSAVRIYAIGREAPPCCSPPCVPVRRPPSVHAGSAPPRQAPASASSSRRGPLSLPPCTCARARAGVGAHPTTGCGAGCGNAQQKRASSRA